MQKSEHAARFDLGLEVMRALAEPGRVFTRREIAAWCDCTPGRVLQLEMRALRKAREAIQALGMEREMALHYGCRGGGTGV